MDFMASCGRGVHVSVPGEILAKHMLHIEHRLILGGPVQFAQTLAKGAFVDLLLAWDSGSLGWCDIATMTEEV